MDDLIVLVDDSLVDNIKVRNRSKQMVCANLNSYDSNGRPKGVIWGPLGRDNERYLTKSELESREVRKLMDLKVLEIRR